MFVDSHAHLDGKQFDSDRESVIERARDAGVKYMLAIGTGNGPPDLEAAVRFLCDLLAHLNQPDVLRVLDGLRVPELELEIGGSRRRLHDRICHHRDRKT